jgi:hypothetical protein
MLSDGPFAQLIKAMALCPDGRLRTCNLGVPDTFFSVPARLNYRVHGKNKSVCGFISFASDSGLSSDPEQWVKFTPTGKWAKVFERVMPTEGTVSHGTMRSEDLIPSFEAVLDAAGLDYKSDRPDAVAKLLDGKDVTAAEQEAIGFYVNEVLFELLDSIAPEGCYFGAHPGDGSDFGYWRSE